MAETATTQPPQDDSWIVLEDGRRVYLPRVHGTDDNQTEGDDSSKANNPNDKGLHLLEKSRSAWGSTAGAGSDFFHVYRKQRAREIARQEHMDKDWLEKNSASEFQRQRAEGIQKVLTRQKVKSEKRKRRKLNASIRQANERAEERQRNKSQDSQQSSTDQHVNPK